MAKPHILPFEYGPLRLRLLEEADLPLTLKWRNQDHIRRWFFHSDLISPQQHFDWFRGYSDRDDDFVFIIEEAQAEKLPIGQVSIYHVDWEERSAEFGRLMIAEPQAAGRGLARVATQAALSFAFQELGMEEVYLEVYKENVKAVTIYRNVGFQIEKVWDNIIKMRIFDFP